MSRQSRLLPPMRREERGEQADIKEFALRLFHGFLGIGTLGIDLSYVNRREK